MKRFFLYSLACLIVFLPLVRGIAGEEHWKKVEALIDKKRPKSALAALAPMEAAALAEKAWPDAARALATRIMVESSLEQDRPEGRLVRMEEALAKAPAEMQPVLLTLQAEWFYEYLRSNGWKIMKRNAGPGGDDIAAWDLWRVLKETDARFQKALSYAAVLRQTPIAEWNGLLKPGGLPEKYQPTLYDFLAGEALAYYMMGELDLAGVRMRDSFELTGDSPALAGMDEFLAWHPEGENSPVLKAVRLFQEVLTFHRNDLDPGVLVMLDLQRLEWMREKTGANERAVQQYTALYQKHASHEISLRARSLLAHLLVQDHKAAEARKLLQEGVAVFGKSLFAPRCRNQILTIEDSELKVGSELIWNAAQPEIETTWRNLKKVYFRLYPVTENTRMPGAINNTYADPKKTRRALKTKPLRAWQVELPPADDFIEHKFRSPAPADLKPGTYLLCASEHGDFRLKKNTVIASHIRVTPLALVVRPRATDKTATLDAWVLDAISGEPLKGAEVALWQWPARKGPIKKKAAAVTGEDGFVSFQPGSFQNSYLFAKHGRHTALAKEIDPRHGDSEYTGAHTFFFTDRAIYRPGQTIQFKGVHVFHDRGKNDYRVLPNVKRNVVFYDANGRDLGAVDVVTNAFGSFSGSFTAPVQGITGEFCIYDGNGRATVHVEEYKRPKFRVEIDPPAVAPKLGGEVAVKVKGLAYTGAPVDGADVEWRVTREAQWPSWSLAWSRRNRDSEAREIAHGKAETAADGAVEVRFTAVPDSDAGPESGAWFDYSIHADVTDTVGETRSAERSVTAGYAIIRAELHVNDWQSASVPVAFSLTTTSLDGEPQQAQGTLVVHRLVQPDKVHRKISAAKESEFGWFFGRDDFRFPSEGTEEKDLSDPASCDSGEVVQRDNVKTAGEGEARIDVKLAPGAYRAVAEIADRLGGKVTARKDIIVVDPEAKKFPVKMPFWVQAPAWKLEPGEEFSPQWGSGYEAVRAFIEIEHRHKIVQQFWTDAGRTQQGLKFKIGEEHRGGFTLHVTQMRDNRLSETTRFVSVPWSNKELNLKWEHLTSKLEPGAKDTWTLTVNGPDKEKTTAEMAAVLYDSSLDAFAEHSWEREFGIFHNDSFQPNMTHTANGEFQNNWTGVNEWGYDGEQVDEDPRTWRWMDLSDYTPRNTIDGDMSDFELMRGQAVYSDEFNPLYLPQTFGGSGPTRFALPTTPTTPVESAPNSGTVPPVSLDLSKIGARKNMAETAFFFPHLTTAGDGTVKITFTMPEAVTTWRFLGFAHDKELRSGFLEGETVTVRELMVQPNPPRFLREGDAVEFTVRVTNQSASPQQGMARLNFADAATLTSADAALGNRTPEQPFTVPAKESRTIAWRIAVPDGQGFLTWKAVAGTDKLTDGEEGWLPVLSRRVPVTESLPLPIRDAGEKSFVFKKLTESAGSETLRHQSLTVQMVSQPAWYAVMALPYLMEYPYECSEQTFNRFYANTLARHIAKSDPKIRRIFDLWRNAQPDAMKSPLEKNADVKSLMIEETPWLRQANKESQRNMGILFDDNRLDSEMHRLMKQMSELQMEDGSWPWFPGGPASDFITLYIVSGFGRLQHLGVEVPAELALKALDRLDNWLADEHVRIMKRKAKEADNFDSTLALYLYGRSFFLEQRPVPAGIKPALDYFLDQARKHWTGVSRMSQAHAALGLLRFGDQAAANEILASLKERSLSSEELGLSWADERQGWSWNQAPVETQALMIEAFRDIGKDEKSVDDCQVWLLKQKQTQAWPTTKATADAVYSILLGGANKLSSDVLVAVSLGGTEVKAENAEAGTGFFEKKFSPAEIKADMGSVKLTKQDKGVAWGSLHWQYMENISKVTPHEGTPLKVTKTLFTMENTKEGPELKPITGKVKVGDELVVRIEIRTDRDMEFVHLKDQRPSSVEPVNVLSGYKWQDGLGYYESTRDTASHFFIDTLKKGTYVFEYSSRVQLRGRCQTGIAELQCMYAPEFNSHSAGATLEVE